ncbi:MAG: hypothetical protein H6Q33_734 [Deltaproteobacteria bacterium]|nr:hypothetical protein [Deltaproteobacteria bacterium]
MGGPCLGKEESDHMNPSECVLFSGGLKGTEATFGATAERYGIEEVNFTFDGHQIERTRGVRTLSHAELQHGDVSLAYVSKLMHRHYPDTDYIKKVLQTIWHQVNNAQEIYVVGRILEDETVMGGTGWGAEFAKLCNKPLCVFDQDRDGWFQWTGSAWQPADAPVIRHPHFAGSGTRFLRDNGRAAIEQLFARSFPRS